MLPLPVIAYELPPQKPPAVSAVDFWEADTLNIDMVSLTVRIQLPTGVTDPLTAEADIVAVTRRTSPFRLHAEDLQIDSVISVPPLAGIDYDGRTLGLRYGSSVTSGDTIRVHVVYRAPPQANGASEGYSRESDIAYTINEPFGARRWLPVHDSPNDRFQWSIAVSPPTGWRVVSNGTREVTGATPIATVASIPAYLTHFAAADYRIWYDTCTTFQGTRVPLAFYARPFLDSMARRDWRVTGDAIRIYSEQFGDYPYPGDGYGMVEAPLLGGWTAMEHQAMTTMGSALISGDDRFVSVVAHELGHQWFGDAITPVQFRDIWLNEGFATFTESVYLERSGLPDLNMVDYRRRQAASYFHEAANSWFAITDPPLENLFSTTVYCKGGWILHMLRRRIGDSTFFARTREYVRRYSFRPVTTGDMIQVYTDDNRDGSTTAFLNEWLYRAGHPILRWQASSSGNRTQVTVRQVQQGGPFVSGIPLVFGIGNQSFPVNLASAESTFVINYPQTQPLRLVWHDDMLYEDALVADSIVRAMPRYAVLQPYPNPSNDRVSLRITLSIPGPTNGTLSLFDPLGRLIYRVPMYRIGSGVRRITPVLPPLSSGVYYWQFRANGVTGAAPMTIVR